MENQELLQKAIMLKQQSEQIEQQLDFVSEQIKELEQFSENLREIEENKEKEILSSLGRGVYVKAERKAGEKLFVEVGARVLVKKTPEEARKIIGEQIKKFQEARIQLTAQLQEYASEFKEMIGEIERVKEEKEQK